MFSWRLRHVCKPKRSNKKTYPCLFQTISYWFLCLYPFLPVFSRVFGASLSYRFHAHVAFSTCAAFAQGNLNFFTTCALRSHTHISLFRRMSLFITYGCADRSYANTCFPHAKVFQNTERVTIFLLFSLSFFNLTRPSHFPTFHRWQASRRFLSLTRFSCPGPYLHHTLMALQLVSSFHFCPLHLSSCRTLVFIFSPHAFTSPADTFLFTPIRPFVATRSLFFLR